MSTMFPENLGAAATASTPEEENKIEEVVDLNEEQTVENPEADFNVIPAPPPAGKYAAKVILGEDGISGRKSAKSGTFLVIPLILKIMAEGQPYDGYEIRDYPNNIIQKMKGTSKAHWILHCLGETVPAKITHQDLKDRFESVLAQEPTIMIDLEWQASYKDPTDRRANKDGYVIGANRMSQFPKLPDGSYSNLFKNPVDGTVVAARGYIPDNGYHKK